MAAKRTPAYEDRVAHAIDAQESEAVPLMAKWFSPIPGMQAVKGKDERSLFWEADPTVDVTLLRNGGVTPQQLQQLATLDPRATPESLQQQGTMLTEEQIGLLKFPHRGVLMQAGGRADDLNGWVKYVNDMVKQGPPEVHPDDPFAEIRDQIQTSPPPPSLPDAQPQPMAAPGGIGQLQARPPMMSPGGPQPSMLGG